MSGRELVSVWRGDCVEVMRLLPDDSVDSVVTDPPYLLGFMGRQWDTKAAHEHIEWHMRWAAECLRILKPGGHLLAFGGTRTWHRLTCAIEDAGFEIRDSVLDLTGRDAAGLAWMYGSGFPKSLDVSKAIDKTAGAEREVVSEGAPVKRMIPGADQDRTGSWIKDNGRVFVPTVTKPATEEAQHWQGWGTALKPAWEPIVVARKPLAGTVAGNVLAHGTGALNIDGCRIEGDVPATVQGQSQNAGDIYGADQRHLREFVPSAAGRWPANVVLGEDAAAELDEQTGKLTSGNRKAGTYGLMGYQGSNAMPMPEVNGDSGGPSRFFATFKYQAKASAKERPKVDGKGHPTVKPLELIRWLVRLATPPGGLVVDPFAGSGTTGEACILEGFRCMLIENDEEHGYHAMIEQRLVKYGDAP